MSKCLPFQFSKQSVLDSYSSFVENYNTSGKVIEIALANKSSTQKIIEVCLLFFIISCCLPAVKCL